MLVLAATAIYSSGLVGSIRSRIAKSPAESPALLRGKSWDLPAVFIVVVFFFSWLPYVFIGRATYIYHFYLSIPLLCLAITYFINKYWNKPMGKVAAIAIFAGAVAMFALFYPVISGVPVEPSYIHRYLDWFPSRFYAP
jgi:dolichyl-phosphate-mannose--protein O-mannosyl transferase